MEAMNRELGYYNESFVPDVELQDGDLIQLGNTTSAVSSRRATPSE